jgi:hypothetical protein
VTTREAAAAVTTDRTGKAHSNLDPGASTAIRALLGPSCAALAGRPPVDATRRSLPSVETWSVPSRSVRKTRAPSSDRRATVRGAGCPYGLPSPALISATRGASASTNAWEVAVPLPWWATLRTSSRCPPFRAIPAASSCGSISSSTSPMSSIRRSPKRTSNTMEVSLIALPWLGDREGTVPRIGHRTSRVAPSNAR